MRNGFGATAVDPLLTSGGEMVICGIRMCVILHSTPLPHKVRSIDMKPTLLPGLKSQVEHRVVTQELLSSIYPGGPPVFATPWLLSLMEQAAAEAIVEHLDPG